MEVSTQLSVLSCSLISHSLRLLTTGEPAVLTSLSSHRHFADDFETSGTWHQLRDICKNDSTYMSRIEGICTQAHNKAGKIEGGISIALCFTRKLIFRDSQKYEPIKLDIICYVIEGLSRANGSPYYFYITKGLAPNCVYYLKPLCANDTSRLWLDEHICGIIL